MYALNTFALIIIMTIAIGVSVGAICVPIAFLISYMDDKGIVDKVKGKMKIKKDRLS